MNIKPVEDEPVKILNERTAEKQHVNRLKEDANKLVNDYFSKKKSKNMYAKIVIDEMLKLKKS